MLILVPSRVAFVCAMPMEINPLKRMLSFERTEIDSLVVYAGSLGGRPAVTIVTGIGGMLASEGVKRLLDAIDIEQVVVVGITGAIDDEIPIGTVVVPTVVVNAATGAEFRPKQVVGSTPSGTMWTSNELITDLEVIARLRANGVIALDMETAAIAEICQRRNVPWSVFRAISDRATDASLDDEVFTLVNPDGTFNFKRVAAFLLKHPRRWSALAHLAKDAKLAAEHAAHAAVTALSQPSLDRDT